MKSEDEKELTEEYLYNKHISNTAQNVQSGEFKISEKYDRNNYVDYAAKKKMDEFKEKQFGDGDVYVNQYGQKLEKASTDPNSKPETDHKVASKRTHKYAVDSGMKHITDEDIKRAINRESNYELISKTWNTSKGSQSDKEFSENQNKSVKLTKEQEKKLKKTSLISDIGVGTELHIVNAGKGFADNAASSAATAAASNLMSLANGDKTLPEAAVDTVVDGVKLNIQKTVTEEATSIAKGGLKEIEKNLAKEIGKKKASQAISKSVQQGVQFVSNNLGSIVQVGVMMSDSIVKYVNGEIDGSELLIDAGGVGAVLAADFVLDMTLKPAVMNIVIAAGGVVGGPVGAAVGAAVGWVVSEMISLIVSSGIAKGLLAFKQILNTDKIHKQKCKLIDKLSKQAVKDMKQRQKELKKMITFEFSRWDGAVSRGFKCICDSLLSDDVDGVTQGLTTILSVINPKVQLETYEEFKNNFKNKDEFTITV